MTLEIWKNGNIYDAPVPVSEDIEIGSYGHYQVRPEVDAEICAFLNDGLEAFFSTERIGDIPKGTVGVEAYRQNRSVVVSRQVDDLGRIHYAFIASL